MFKNISIVTAAFICLMAVSVSAQGLSIGPQVGYQKSQDADGSYMAGASMRLKLTPSLGVEGAINYRKEEVGNLSVKSWPILVSALFYPLPVLPVYGVAGGGWYNTTFDFDDSNIDNETKQEFGWHFGAGVEIPLGKNKLYGDIRYVFLDYSFDDLPTDIDSNFYTIMVGYQIGL